MKKKVELQAKKRRRRWLPSSFQTITARACLIKAVLCIGWLPLLNQQSVGSGEATPLCQSTAMKPQLALTPVDSHQASCWDSKTNEPPLRPQTGCLEMRRSEACPRITLRGRDRGADRCRAKWKERAPSSPRGNGGTGFYRWSKNVIKRLLLSYKCFHTCNFALMPDREDRKKNKQTAECGAPRVWIRPLCSDNASVDFASDVWTSVDVSSLSEIVGCLLPGMGFGKQLGLDSVQDGGLFDAAAMFSAVGLFFFFLNFKIFFRERILNLITAVHDVLISTQTSSKAGVWMPAQLVRWK